MAKKTDADKLLKLRAKDAPGPLINVLVFLEAVISAELIKAEWAKRFRRTNETALDDALLHAFCRLESEAREYADRVRSGGMLLFAHADTTVFDGGAA